MRGALCRVLVEQADRSDFVFLTGDLGYAALEPLRDVLDGRFINAGLAEQNMVSVAAGLASTGLRPWVYSIAPFIYSRALEQVRNDVDLHDLPVRLVGNGGGFAYGVMGATHHALEDYGTLLCLPHMRAFVPAFADDVPVIVRRLMDMAGPSYLRLGRCEKPKDAALPTYAGWRRLSAGEGPTMVVVGPLAGAVLGAALQLPVEHRPRLWVLSELPVRFDAIPEAFLDDLRQSRRLSIVEEHVMHGSAGQALCHQLSIHGAMCGELTHHYARGYLSGLYGSQDFHRRECGLDPATLLNTAS